MSVWVGFLVIMVASGLGVRSNPKAPKPAEVLRHAPADADLMAFVDFRATLPGGFDFLKKIQEMRFVQDEPELRQGMREAMEGLETAFRMVEQQTGLRVMDDLGWGAVWLRFGPSGPPTFLAVLNGKLPTDLLDRVARLANAQVAELGGKRILRMSFLPFAIGQLDASTLVAGSTQWVEERMGRQAPQKPTGGPPAAAARHLAARPFLLVASAPSAVAVARIREAAQEDRDMRAFEWLLTGHEATVVSLAADGVRWTFTARDQDGFEKARMASEGTLDLMRAFQHGGRGLLRLAYAFSDELLAMADDDVRALVSRHRQEIYDLAMTLVGSGGFKGSVRANARTRTVEVAATAKKLADVLPIGGILPVLGASAFWFLARSPGAYEKAEPKSAPPARSPDVDDAPEESPEPTPSGMDVNPGTRPIQPIPSP